MKKPVPTKRFSTVIHLSPAALILLASILAPLATQTHEQSVLAAADLAASARVVAAYDDPATPRLIEGRPVRLTIPDIGLDVTITDGVLDPTSNAWGIADASADYVTTTALPNSRQGSPVIYGQRHDGMLGKTRLLAPGTVAYLYTANGHVLQYVFDGTTTVDPSDADVFDDAISDHGLKLLACASDWTGHRRLMSFSFITAS